MVSCGLPLIGQKRPAPTLRVPRRPNGAQFHPLRVGEAGGGLEESDGRGTVLLWVGQRGQEGAARRCESRCSKFSLKIILADFGGRGSKLGVSEVGRSFYESVEWPLLMENPASATLVDVCSPGIDRVR